VRHLIRNRRTQAFFRDGHWTVFPGLAQEFPDSTAVIRTSVQYHLTDVELVLQSGAEPSEVYDIHLPLFDHPQVHQVS
jgi:hypothetical protein